MGFLDKYIRRAVQKVAMTQYFGFDGIITNWDDASKYIQDGYEYNATIYSIVSKIANTGALMPVKLVNQDNEEVNNADIQAILKNPNSLETLAEFSKKSVIYNLITGNNIVFILRDDRGNPREIINIPVDEVTILENGYKINNYPEVIPFEDTFHRKKTALVDDNLSSKVCFGMSPLKAASRLVQASNENTNASIGLLKNMGALGILTGEKDAQYDEENLRLLQSEYDKRYSGASNAGKIIISSAAMKFQSMAMSPVDLQLSEANLSYLRELCAIYGIPSELMGDPAGSTYNNKTEAKKALYQDAILPEYNDLIDFLNRYIVNHYDSSLRLIIDTSEIEALQSDKAQMSQWVAVIRGSLTENEVRNMYGFTTIEDDPLSDYTADRLKREGLDGSIPPMMLNTDNNG